MTSSGTVDSIRRLSIMADASTPEGRCDHIHLKEGVSCNQTAVNEKTLTSGSVTWCVDEGDLDVSDSQNVTWFVSNKLIGGDVCGSFHPVLRQLAHESGSRLAPIVRRRPQCRGP